MTAVSRTDRHLCVAQGKRVFGDTRCDLVADGIASMSEEVDGEIEQPADALIVRSAREVKKRFAAFSPPSGTARIALHAS